MKPKINRRQITEVAIGASVLSAAQSARAFAFSIFVPQVDMNKAARRSDMPKQNHNIPCPCALNANLLKEIKRVIRLRRNPSTICNCSFTQGRGDLRMAEKTLLEKAGEAVGFGM